MLADRVRRCRLRHRQHRHLLDRLPGRGLNRHRARQLDLGRKLQAKGTKSAKRLLKRRSRKEAWRTANINHIVSKTSVTTAGRTAPVSPWKTPRASAAGYGSERTSGPLCTHGLSPSSPPSPSTRRSGPACHWCTSIRRTPAKPSPSRPGQVDNCCRPRSQARTHSTALVPVGQGQQDAGHDHGIDPRLWSGAAPPRAGRITTPRRGCRSSLTSTATAMASTARNPARVRSQALEKTCAPTTAMAPAARDHGSLEPSATTAAQA